MGATAIRKTTSSSARRSQVSRSRGRQGVPRAGQAPGQAVSDELCRQRAQFRCPLAGTLNDILAQGMKFYSELSPETKGSSNVLRDSARRALDRGQAGGRCCTTSWTIRCRSSSPTSAARAARQIVTHEAGHAFEAWTNHKRIPIDYIWPSMEACEVHSMSMEFFAEPWADGFWPPTRKSSSLITSPGADVHPLRHDGRPLPAHRV